ncbi:MAG: hypothetical protein UX81_C0003G0023 [Parcubacteria group bacterium GW2011_GWA2_47_12]|uniref:NAD-dependent epimerase/dehydratase domain-containing protein n=1 Tax=Candidatus Giovannonibacteria bacterium RIFCSPLOWO2_01_FULL_44_16 TaxID=1798348 RepID=A0A1F5X1H5_9BACT|nr:MAG: hypothetical protein UX81_C0003G0023 [Parcubacteria group bacterium GW2011_GWA2_47_12]OGF81757.1 MAG: hypothetical protein A2924_00935 [Candidatus Giovannonibacteria bacterium RIFCSPLOWO2_01_FULL_44_16]
MKIFITGSESFVGKELVSQCLKNGIEVAGIDLIDLPSQKYEYKKMDVRSQEISDIMPVNTDAIIHLAAVSRESDCKKDLKNCFDVNAGGTINIIDAAIKNKAHNFIFASSEWVYGESEAVKKETDQTLNTSSPYALSKIIGECALRQRYEESKMNVVVLRFGIIYGPRKNNWAAVESLFNSVATKDTVEVGSLKTGRNFIHVSDIASGIIASLRLPGFNIINLAGSQLITLGDILDESCKILGRHLKIIDQGKPSVVRSISNQKAKEILNWEPAYDLEKGLKNIKSATLTNAS